MSQHNTIALDNDASSIDITNGPLKGVLAINHEHVGGKRSQTNLPCGKCSCSLSLDRLLESLTIPTNPTHDGCKTFNFIMAAIQKSHPEIFFIVAGCCLALVIVIWTFRKVKDFLLVRRMRQRRRLSTDALEAAERQIGVGENDMEEEALPLILTPYDWPPIRPSSAATICDTYERSRL